MSNDIKIGPVLKHLKKIKKMTFKNLSHASGVPISTIKPWSAGVETKSLSHAQKVARALDVSAEYLVFGESSVQAPTISELIITQLFSGWHKVTIEMPVTAPIVTTKE